MSESGTAPASSASNFQQGAISAIQEASSAIAQCLTGVQDFKWTVVGGAGLVMLRSTRYTKDVDIVISPMFPKSLTATAVNLFFCSMSNLL